MFNLTKDKKIKYGFITVITIAFIIWLVIYFLRHNDDDSSSNTNTETTSEENVQKITDDYIKLQAQLHQQQKELLDSKNIANTLKQEQLAALVKVEQLLKEKYEAEKTAKLLSSLETTTPAEIAAANANVKAKTDALLAAQTEAEKIRQNQIAATALADVKAHELAAAQAKALELQQQQIKAQAEADAKQTAEQIKAAQIKAAADAEAATKDSFCTLYKNADYPNDTSVYRWYATIDECVNACFDNDNCNFAVYNNNTRDCLLKKKDSTHSLRYKIKKPGVDNSYKYAYAVNSDIPNFNADLDIDSNVLDFNPNTTSQAEYDFATKGISQFLSVNNQCYTDCFGNSYENAPDKFTQFYNLSNTKLILDTSNDTTKVTNSNGNIVTPKFCTTKCKTQIYETMKNNIEKAEQKCKDACDSKPLCTAYTANYNGLGCKLKGYNKNNNMTAIFLDKNTPGVTKNNLNCLTQE